MASVITFFCCLIAIIEYRFTPTMPRASAPTRCSSGAFRICVISRGDCVFTEVFGMHGPCPFKTLYDDGADDLFRLRKNIHLLTEDLRRFFYVQSVENRMTL